jgi:hypothetical protein
MGRGRLHYETLAICRQLAYARAVFKVAVAEKPAGRFMIRSRRRVVKRHPEGDCSGARRCQLCSQERRDSGHHRMSEMRRLC